MKRTFFIASLAAALLLQAHGAAAQDRLAHHRLGGWVAGGYSGMMSNVDSTSLGLGYFGQVGLMYEFQKSHFIANLGIGFNYQDAGTKVNDMTQSLAGQVDSEGETFTLNYTFGNRRDRASVGYLQVPLMLGAQMGGFYFLAGGKAGFSLMGSTRVKTDVSTSGTYERFVGEFVSMENHGFTSGEALSSKGDALKLNMDAAASIELGWVLGQRGSKETGFDAPKQGKVVYRLGVFADYGLLNIHKNEERNIIELPPSGASSVKDIKPNHIFATRFAEDAKVSNLFVGVKFTMLFELPKRGHCIHCDDF